MTQQMSLFNDLPPRNFKALFAALLKLDFYDDAGVSLDIIETQIFGGSSMEPAAIAALLAALREVLADAAKGRWSVEELDAKLKASELSAEHAKAAVAIWRADCDKVQAVLMRRSTWNSTLRDVAWRVDIATNSKRVKEVDEPVAIVELNTNRGVGGGAAGGAEGGAVVRFELSRSDMKKVLGQFAVIEERLNKHLQ